MSYSSSSSSKKKKKKAVRRKNGVLRLVDDDDAGNKVKKVVKKKKIKQSTSKSSFDRGESTDDDADLFDGSTISSYAQESVKTSKTSSVNSSSTTSDSSQNKKKKQETSNKNSIREIDGVPWRVDDKGNQIKKLRRKSEISTKNNDNTTRTTTAIIGRKEKNITPMARRPIRDRDFNNTSNSELSQTGHASNRSNIRNQNKSRVGLSQSLHITTTTLLSPPSRSPKISLSRQQPQRHKSADALYLMSSVETPTKQQPQRRKSADALHLLSPLVTSKTTRRRKLSGGGGLDVLMSQSVHQHTRKNSSTEKPSLIKSKSTLGDFFRRSGDKEKIDSSKVKPETLQNLPTSHSLSADKKEKLPKNVKEIDGILWRLDEDGNKIKKVRRKSTTDFMSDADCAATTTGHSTGGNSGGCSKSFRVGRRRNSRGSIGSKDNSGEPSRSKSADNLRSRSRGRKRSTPKEILDDSENSFYLEDTPIAPQRGRSNSHERQIIQREKDGNEIIVDGKTGKRLRPKKKQSLTSSRNNQSSSESQMYFVDPDTAFQMVADLEIQLMASQREVLRLSQVTKQQKVKVDETAVEKKKIKARYQTAMKEKQRLDTELEQLKIKLEVREQELLRKQQELEKQQKAALEHPAGGDHLVEQITDLMCENNTLLDKMGVEKAKAGLRMEKKEEELRFLQDELERMRSERDERAFENMHMMKSKKGKGDTNKTATEKPTSLQLVDKIWNQKNDVDDETYRRQMKELQERVDSLQMSNEKLKKDLEMATLEIKDDDDEEIRKAKEMAQAVSQGRLTRTNSARADKDNVLSSLLIRTQNEAPLLALSLSLHGSGHIGNGYGYGNGNDVDNKQWWGRGTTS